MLDYFITSFDVCQELFSRFFCRPFSFFFIAPAIFSNSYLPALTELFYLITTTGGLSRFFSLRLALTYDTTSLPLLSTPFFLFFRLFPSFVYSDIFIHNLSTSVYLAFLKIKTHEALSPPLLPASFFVILEADSQTAVFP